MFSASARRPARWFCRPSASAASSDIAWLSPSCSCCSSLSPVFDDMAQALDGVHEYQSQPYTSPDAETSASSESRLHVEKVWKPSQGFHISRVGSRRALLGANRRGKVWKPSQGFHINC